MELVEQHIVKKSNPLWKDIDLLCFKSKNLYNSGLYTVRQELFATGRYLDYYTINRIFNEAEQRDYEALPNNTSQQVLLILHNNMKNHFKASKAYKKNPNNFTGKPRLPYYKDKKNGRNLLVFTANQFSIKGDYIHFAKKSGLPPLKTSKADKKIKQVRIIPHSSHYTIEVVYEQAVEAKVTKNDRYMSIDYGLNNLAACVDSANLNCFIINGCPLKSVNQYYNKQLANYQSDLAKYNKGQYVSNKTKRLTLKRSY
jgi:putative transposase